MKTCSKCGIEKEEAAFNRQRGKRSARCSECLNEARRATYADNPQIFRERSRAYYDLNEKRTRDRLPRDVAELRKKEAAKRWSVLNKDAARACEKQSSARARQSLADWYVESKIRRLAGLDIPIDGELIQAKRQQLQLHRLGRAIKAQLKEKP